MFSRRILSNFNPRSPHGERRNQAGLVPPAERISIHAPRTGSDGGVWIAGAMSKDFNPRSPHGERRRLDEVESVSRLFQSTLPARGATALPAAPFWMNQISIHAPRTGSDANPHAAGRSTAISIHAPRTGSDYPLFSISCGLSGFQSTLPARGATPSWTMKSRRASYFNPRSPHGERQIQSAE